MEASPSNSSLWNYKAETYERAWDRGPVLYRPAAQCNGQCGREDTDGRSTDKSLAQEDISTCTSNNININNISNNNNRLTLPKRYWRALGMTERKTTEADDRDHTHCNSMDSTSGGEGQTREEDLQVAIRWAKQEIVSGTRPNKQRFRS